VLNRAKIVMIITVLLVAGTTVVVAGPKWSGGPNPGVDSSEGAEATPQKTTGPPAEPPPTREENIGAGEDYVRKLLLLMDTDKNGKVSKKEFMTFMEAEFERLDKNHDGELDVKELAGLRVRPYLGK